MGILEQGLGHLLIISRSSHLFNKTDLQQLLSLYSFCTLVFFLQWEILFALQHRVASRAGLFGSGSDLKLTKFCAEFGPETCFWS